VADVTNSSDGRAGMVTVSRKMSMCGGGENQGCQKQPGDWILGPCRSNNSLCFAGMRRHAATGMRKVWRGDSRGNTGTCIAGGVTIGAAGMLRSVWMEDSACGQ
jgi:hypothetical protein